ncbi:MAG: chromosome segregation protein SMC [Elusimicrobia bacterium]|nr:chromosome segregation protein SMC [Elusimicrobiota bacterium]
MHLKSIDILGYKSFANKTHLDLEPGITGIIGPNGCGKSNIMEAVRWCLGEMSWKSLRADSMVDVIFSGTAKRPALSMTEVMLTFDNSKGLLPIPFSEVTVMRRIFRSGESAYFLNKTQCRLKDIRELFLDTGLGGDGYAIIDQGGVDFILNSKPEDRRSIFEEAAGVSKYKAKREEALRKLEKVEVDLSRLQDSVTLISEQVRKLDNDAKRARLYTKYKEELAGLEAAHILQEASRIGLELEALAAAMVPVEEALGTRRVEMDAEGANLAALNLQKADQQGQVMACSQRIAQVKSEIGRLEERIQAAERSAAESEARSSAAQAEREATTLRLEAIGPEIDKASAAAEQAAAAVAAAESEAATVGEQLRALEAQVSQAQAALDRFRQEMVSAAEQALTERRRLSETESSLTRQETQLRHSLRELEKDIAQAEMIGAEIGSAESLLAQRQAAAAEARAVSESAQLEIVHLRQRQEDISRSIMEAHSELAHARARQEALESQGGHNPYWTGAQAVINAGIEGVLGTVRQMFRVEESWRQYLEDALGERLYAVVCEDSTAARTAIELLDASGKGRARFLVLSSLPAYLGERAYPEQARPILRHLDFDPRHERALRFLLQEAYELDKALFSDHWVYGGAVPGSSERLSLADIDEVRQTVVSLQERVRGLEQDRALCAEEIGQAELRRSERAEALARAMAEEKAGVAQLEEKRSSLEVVSRNIELSNNESAELLSEMALIMERHRELRQGIKALEDSEKAARLKESDAQEALAVLREELARSRAQESLSESHRRNLQERLVLFTGQYERLEQEKTALQSSAERRRQEIEELARRKEEELRQAVAAREALGGLHGELASLENESKALFDRLQELESQISAREQNLRALQQAAQEAQEKLHGYEIQASALRSTQDSLKRRLWDDWQLAYDEAKNKFQGQEVDPGRIEHLRKRLSSMGNINLAAPEEYEALAQRQGFLTSQIADLNAAKEDLRNAIQKINGATRENFRQTFTEVREHFRRLYGVLFEGGEADLILTDPENLLETGVEIVAQPPGKRLQQLSLLSGGEKALTAAALLFAFFMVKPSPFCMLDEADAALDDANVQRFVSLLREFQNRTQFLIVSHNKRTMEAADVIYGVTMEEMGISQLVSVDFRKKSSPAPSSAQPLFSPPPLAEPAS